jgi:sirohydrochlorin cobaltochelatase
MNRLKAFLALTLLLASAAASAQQPAAPELRTGAIVLAHGGSEEWNRRVIEVVAQVRSANVAVEVSFLMGPAAKAHRFQDAARRLVENGARELVVVPLLVSSHSGHYDQIRYLVGALDTLSEMMMHHLEMSGIDRPDVEVPIHLARAIDDSPDAARVLASRALILAPEPTGRALFLLGHGPNSLEDLAVWMKHLRTIADTVKAMTGFSDVRVGLVQDDTPPAVRAEAVNRAREMIELQAGLTGQPVVVVPVLISKGQLGDSDIPTDLVGLPVVYSGEPLLPHPAIARWIESRVREALESKQQP